MARAGRNGECLGRIRPLRPTMAAAAMAIGAIVANGACTAAQKSDVQTCGVNALNALGVADLHVTSAETVRAAKEVPEYCRVFGTVVTKGHEVDNGSARVQLSLPSNWNGKFLFLGGGGFDGLIRGVDSPQNLIRGYAIVGTDSGHVANPDVPIPSNDASWAIVAPGVPDEVKLADYFYRSRHSVAVATKALVTSYYGRTIERAYMTGCSNGGHEGIKHAMTYPDDFEGIVAGNPWIDQPGNQLWSLRNIKALMNAWIPPTAYPAIQQAVFDQCDAVDGVVDRLVQNPLKCAFNPDTLVPGVLNQAQANALKTYFSAVRDEDGRLVFPGGSIAGIGDTSSSITGLATHAVRYIDSMENLASALPPSTPAGPQPWGDPWAGSADWTMVHGFIAYMGYRDPAVNLMSDLVIDRNGRARKSAVELLYSRTGAGLADDPVALRPYIKKNRKLLIYDGYADHALNAYEKILFYRALATDNGGYERIQDHVRMFMVPDMQHCSGGTGPNSFDALTALENWVERGMAPEFLLASHRTGGVVNRTMPVCMFPRQAEYRGNGDVNDARNWSCAANQKLLELGPHGVAVGLGDDDEGGGRLMKRTG